MTHEDSLVDLRLPEPRGLVDGVKHLDGDVVSAPLGEPHLSVAALPDRPLHLHLLRDGPLHEQRQPRPRPGRLLYEVGQAAGVQVRVGLGVRPRGLHVLLPRVLSLLVTYDERNDEYDEYDCKNTEENILILCRLLNRSIHLTVLTEADCEGHYQRDGRRLVYPGAEHGETVVSGILGVVAVVHDRVHGPQVPVAEIPVGAAGDGGGLHVRHEVPLTLQHPSLVVGRLAAVGEGGAGLAGRLVDDLADGREALGAEARHARPRLRRRAADGVVRRAVAGAVAGEAAEVSVLSLRRPKRRH